MSSRSRSFLLIAAVSLFISASIVLAQCRWISLSNSLPPARWFSISFNPANPQTIYAGGSLLVVSHDQGKTWRTLSLPSGMNDVRMIIILPQDTTQLFIGGFDLGLWKSSDAGLNWRLVLSEVNFDGVSIVIDPVHPDTMHVGSYNKGFYSSYDRGEHWLLVNSDIGGFCSMTIRPDSANVLLGGTRNGSVSKSRDYGQTWREVTLRQANEVPLVAFHPRDPSIAYGSVYGIDNDYGVIKSTDGGETWQAAGLFGLNTWALALDPNDTQRVFAGGFGTFINTESSGKIYFTEDGSVTWQVSTTGLPSIGNAWMLTISSSQVHLALTANPIGGSGIYKLLDQTTSPPFAPQGLAARETGTGSTALLYWNRAFFCAAPITEYILYYGTMSGEYSDSISARLDTSLTLSRLQEGRRYFATIIARDANHRLSEPAPEISFVPQSIPAAPRALRFQRKLRGVKFTWPLNLELDIAGYNLYRAFNGSHVFEKVNATIIADTVFSDEGLSSQKYFFYLSAVDHSGLESLPSPPVKLRPITREKGIVLIDETRDGNGALGMPTDAEVDAFYRRLLANFRFEEYDVARSGIPDDTLGAYATLIWHADLPTNNSLPALAPFLQEYLDAGGQLLLCGWNVLRGFSNSTIQTFDKLHFVARYLHLDTSWVTTSPQFEAAEGVATQYGFLPIDSAKVAIPSWNGRLRDVNVFAPAREAATAFRFVSHDTNYAFHRRPVGVKSIGNQHRVMTLGFPLYFIQEEQARNALREILKHDFGHEVIAVAESPSQARPKNFELRQNHPNPWVHSTTVRFNLAQTSRINLEVFDVLGRLRATLLDADCDRGAHEVVLELRSLPSGIYFYRLTAQRSGKMIYRQTHKMAIVR